MSTDMDALFGAATTTGSDASLSRVAQLIAEEGDTLNEKSTAEEMVRAAKERLNEIYHDRLPAALLAAGVTSFTDGEGIKVSLDLAADGALGSANTPEERAERDKKLDLIEANGGREIIKLTVEITFPKEKHQAATMCRAKVTEWLEAQGLKGVTVSTNRSIHHQTLKKWIKEQMEAGVALPLDDLGIWYGQIGKIKRPKAKAE